MNKRVQKILLIFLCGYFLAPAANGKVWLLPDYQARQLYSHRVNKEDSSKPSDRPQGVNCHMYGFIPASEIGEGVSCSSQTRIMNVTCYGDCACLPTYNKTESSCRLEGKIPGGSVCMEEYYTECLCDTSLYPHTSSSCVYNLSGASCSDNNGKHYTECIDPCEGLVDNTTDLGCEKWYDQCPSMCEIGKICVPNNCSEYTLSSCPVGNICESCTKGCGDDIPLYKSKGCLDGYYRVDGQCTKIEGEISLTFNVESNEKVALYMTIDDYLIDWGDGQTTRTTAKNPTTTVSTISHTYTDAGDYQVKVEGNIKRFSVSSSTTANLTRINRLDLGSITSYQDAFNGKCANTTGTIPALPKGLTNGYAMFDGCSGLTGDVPALPDSLTQAFAMFRNCSGLDGKITSFGSGLKEAPSMFVGCKNLTGNIPPLPKSLTSATSMFSGCSKLTGDIPALPDSLTNGLSMFEKYSSLNGKITYIGKGLTNGYQMFDGCSNLIGDVPALPDGLTKSFAMFRNCSNLDGKIISLGKGLKEAPSMFAGCKKLTGPIPALPDSLTNASSMFTSCQKLTGDIPALPDNLTSGNYMFQNCSGLNGKITSFGKSLTSATGMFDGCSSLTGDIPALPDSLTTTSLMFRNCKNLDGRITSFGSGLKEANSMFIGCSKLTGNVPTFPDSLTNGNYMFSGCSGLTGVAPAKPAGLTSYTQMFKGTQVTQTSEWPSSAW